MASNRTIRSDYFGQRHHLIPLFHVERCDAGISMMGSLHWTSSSLTPVLPRKSKRILTTTPGNSVLLYLTDKWEALWCYYYVSLFHYTDHLGINQWYRKPEGVLMIFLITPLFCEKIIKPEIRTCQSYSLDLSACNWLTSNLPCGSSLIIIQCHLEILINHWGMMRCFSVNINFDLNLNILFQINLHCYLSVIC